MRNILFFLAVALLTSPTIMADDYEAKAKHDSTATKKAVMDAFVRGTLSDDYVPAAFFVHFDRDHKEGEAAVEAHLDFLRKTDADVLKVQFEQHVARIPHLDRQATWDSICPIAEDYYRPTLEIVRRLQQAVGRDVYVMPTVYSAYQVARQSLRDEGIARAPANVLLN